MSIVRKIVSLGSLAYLSSVLLLGQSGDAHAAYRRVHSSSCHATSSDAENVYNGTYLESSVSRSVVCPAPSDSELQHNHTSTLNVHGRLPAGGDSYSEACVKYYNAAGISCGPVKYWGAGFDGARNVDTSVWKANETGMPFVFHWLSAQTELYGFYMQN